MKKVLALLLCLILTLGAAAAEETASVHPAGLHEIEQKDVPFYLADAVQIPFTVYFMDGEYGIPWVEMDYWAEYYPHLTLDKGWQLAHEAEGSTYTLTRESGYTMTLDFEYDTITFIDYNYFLAPPDSTNLVDLLIQGTTGFDAEGRPFLFQRQDEACFNRPGEIKVFDLASYGIHLVMQDGKYYAPLSTLADIGLAPKNGRSIIFNGEALFFYGSGTMGTPNNLTGMGEVYYSAAPRERTEAEIKYGYGELCLLMDNLYGQKDSHQITDFDTLFNNLGIDAALQTPDAAYADLVLNAFISNYMDDSHSGFLLPSWMAGVDADLSLRVYGKNYDRAVEAEAMWGGARAKFYPDGVPGYEEVGNTAYVTFDSFVFTQNYNYYEASDEELLQLGDTLGLIIYAHRRITREDSPIENVVLDLSNNSGGMADAAVFVIGWFLGQADIVFQDKNTGAQSSVAYKTDVNLDREFDEKDTLKDKNLYCLISPVSFSCGNLAPAAFKSSHRVTLIGRTSGGGSSVVQFLTTTWGSMFCMSGPKNLSLMKNGSLYSIDQGIEPDYYLSKVSNYYDRAKLTDIINNMD